MQRLSKWLLILVGILNVDSSFAQTEFIRTLSSLAEQPTNCGSELIAIDGGYLISNYLNFRPFPLFRLANGLIRVDDEGDTAYWKEFDPDIYGYSAATQKLCVIGDTAYLSFYKYDGADVNPGITAVDATTGEVLWVVHDTTNQADEYDRVMVAKGNELFLITSDSGDFSSKVTIHSFSSSGIKRWSKNIPIDHILSPSSVATVPDGLLFACAAQHSFYGYSMLLKLDDFGNKVWSRIIDTTDVAYVDWIVPQVATCLNGDILTTSIKDTFGFVYLGAPIVNRLSSNGDVLWSYTSYDVDEQLIFDVIEANNGDILTAGYSGIGRRYYPGIFGSGGWLQRLSAEGQLLYERRIVDTTGSNTDDVMWFGSILEDPDSKLVVSGSISQEPNVNHFYEKFIFGRLNENGCMNLQCDSMDLTALTQTFAPLGAKWHYQSFSLDCDTHNIIVITATSDTLLINKKSRVLEIYNSEIDSTFELIVWEDDNRVFFHEDGEFKLMYDFTLEFMDTLVFHVPRNRALFSFKCDAYGDVPIQYPQKAVVTSVDWVDLNGEQYKRLATQPIVEDGAFAIDLGFILEKVGSLNGLAGFATVKCVAKGCDGQVRCYEDDEVFFTQSDVECDYRTTSVNDGEVSPIVVYPNPAGSTIYISGFKDLSDHVQILTCFGDVIDSGRRSEVNIATLPSGIYFIKITTKSGNASFINKFYKL